MKHKEKIWSVGLLGCGDIAGVYAVNIKKYFPRIQIVGCAAGSKANARQFADTYNIPEVYETMDLIHHPGIEVIINLTPPQLHYQLNREILLAGKHVYSEKPLALTGDEINTLKNLADEKGCRIGGAPDTWLGAGIQTAAHYIREGAIGQIVSFTANFMSPGVESWHPNPLPYYLSGGGPVLDMGPYYITALTALLGTVKEVQSYSRCPRSKRRIESQPRRGEVMEVEINTSYAAILKFASGAIGNINLSFDVYHSRLPLIEIYGTEGQMTVPDPNWFDGAVEVNGNILPHIYQVPSANLRGLGLWDMLYGIEHDQLHRTNIELLSHVMEVLLKLNLGQDNPVPGIVSKCPQWNLIAGQIKAEEGTSICLTKQ